MKKQKSLIEKIIDTSSSIYKKIRFFLRLAMVTFIAGIISVIIIIKNTDPNKYKENITSSIEKLTGTPVKINGNLKLLHIPTILNAIIKNY